MRRSTELANLRMNLTKVHFQAMVMHARAERQSQKNVQIEQVTQKEKGMLTS